MLEEKKSKGGLVCIIIGIVFILIGLLIGGGGLLTMGALGLIMIIVAIVIISADKKDSKQRAEKLEALRAAGQLVEVEASIAAGTAKEFKKLKLIITPENIVCNTKDFCVIPRANVVKAFRCNMADGKYDMDNMHIALLLADQSGMRIGFTNRGIKNQDFYEALAMIKSTCQEVQ